MGTTRTVHTAPAQPSLLRQLSGLSLLEVVDEGAPEGTIVYLETLLDALEDGEISDEEAQSFADLIAIYKLTDDDLHAAHRAFILALAHKAVDDGHVSHPERAELRAMCDALDVSPTIVEELIARATHARAARKSAGLRPLPSDWSLGEPLRVGDRVAFTGCDERQRDRLERRASELGVRVMSNVSRLTAMLVTDGTMDGTKLARAREVGTRLVHPDTFETLLAHLQPVAPADERARAVASTTTPRTPVTRTSTTSRGDTAPRVALSSTTSPSVVRSWALANGYPVGVRGRLSSEVWEAFAAVRDASAPAGSGGEARVAESHGS